MIKKIKSVFNRASIPIVEIFSKAISFVNILLLIRVVNIYEYADYSYALAIVLWTSILMDGGINNYIYNKCLNREKEGINQLYTARFFLSIIVITALGLFFYITNPDFYIVITLLSVIIYFTSTSSLIKMLSRGLGYSKVDLLSIVLEPLLKLILLTIIYFTKDYFSYNLIIVLTLYLLASVVAFILNKKYLSTYFSLKVLYGQTKDILQLINKALTQSKYYLLYFLMFIGIMRMDFVFIEKFAAKTELAIFSSAFSIYQVAQLFFFSIITSQFLKIVKNTYKSLGFIFSLIVLIGIFISALSPFVYEILFPEEYESGQKALRYLVFALIPSVFVFFMITRNNYLNKTKRNFIALLIVFIIKITVYSVVQSSSIYFYCTVIGIIETIALIFLITDYYFILKTDKTIRNKVNDL
ncbi:oligosaccharide flippase family protein [Psychroserpens sp. SPM9]|uniref:oligosaccharide flippase family protein n=1 Tax=Psychroserpens sp. SPM9 TaxID=2975598 RepID=UPI0021A53ABA|nr:oligosaccharide flippase family protein [Psychroserpens sp. SPM9]